MIFSFFGWQVSDTVVASELCNKLHCDISGYEPSWARSWKHAGCEVLNQKSLHGESFLRSLEQRVGDFPAITYKDRLWCEEYDTKLIMDFIKEKIENGYFVDRKTITTMLQNQQEYNKQIERILGGLLDAVEDVANQLEN